MPYRRLIGDVHAPCASIASDPQTQQEATLARAKNISRAEARRRTREALRSEDAEFEASEELDAAAEPASAPERPRMFRMPNVRADIRALPSVFRARRLLWVPPLLLLGGFVIILLLPALPAPIDGLADLYIQFFFVPPALFTFFIAGFLAPRASYLVGFLNGILASVLWTITLLGTSGALSPAAAATTSTTPPTDPFLIFGNMLLLGALYGTLAAGFAAWYRDFLRSMQDRGKQRRADAEAKERAKRREERQESRRVFKKPT